MRKQFLLILTLAVPVLTFGADTDTVGVVSSPAATLPDDASGISSRIVAHHSMLPAMAEQSYCNPAIMQWRQNYSYTEISGNYRYSGENKAIDVQRGKGSSLWSFEADSYIKYKTSTLWGSASYRNGRQRGVSWNESSDASIIYPYFAADSIGGNLHVENYNFAGGYADHNGRWSWGATISYSAGLYYRNVDPRPRNTTSRLDAAVGGAMRIGATDYNAGVSANYRKYKQSCDIEFVNELSDNSIWHVTGLGTHYERFASSGYNHYYNGNRWGASVNLFPSSQKGAVASAAYHSFKFDHILTSFNKLPLETATDNSIDISAGWLAPGAVHDWAAVASMTHGKRTGTENIFGDASGNVYPQIGSLDLYTHAYTTARLNLLWQWHPSASAMLSVSPEAVWSHSREKYADPRRELLLSSVTPAVTVRGTSMLGNRWTASLQLHFACSLPVDNSCDLPYNSKIPAGLQDVDIFRYNILSKSYTTTSVGASATRSLNDRYALALSAYYSHSGYTAGIHADRLSVSAAFVF